MLIIIYLQLNLLFMLMAVPLFGEEVALMKHQEVVAEATNPITYMNQFQTENEYSTKNYNADGDSNTVLLKPIVYMRPGKVMPLAQMIRVKIQIVTLARNSTERTSTTLGDTQIFDLFLVEEAWGRWGVGPVAFLPTAGNLNAGQGKWQIGPACGATILKFPKWQIGFLAQNPISFAGNRNMKNVNTLYFMPFWTRQLTHDWYINSDAEWTIDWRNHQVQIPVNIGVGRVFALGGNKLNLSVEGEWMAYKHATIVVPQFTFKVNINLLYPE